MFEFTDEDFMLGLLGPDYAAQLRAVHEMLRLRAEADKAFDLELRDIREFAKTASGSASIQAENDLIDHLHSNVYTDAAHSMAAAGMLAPFTESLFTQAFLSVEKLFEERGRPVVPRQMLNDKDPWDCHFVIASRKVNFVRGVLELSDAIGLIPLLPSDLEKTLGALFGYRNKMFHHGFEWPMKERVEFERRIAQEWPPEWFEKSESDHKPWIFYMSRAFVDHCLQMIDHTIRAFGRLARQSL